MNKLALFALLAFSWIFVGCDKEEPIPAYIYIPSIEMNAQTEFGTSSSKITEAWVYADNSLLGVFPFPALVPILETGDTKIQVFSGIHENGILTRPTIYPFYETVEFTQNLEPGEVDTISVSTAYLSSDEMKLGMNITFDVGNVLTEDLDDDSTTFVQIEPDGFEGPCGKLMVNDSSKLLIVGAIGPVGFPQNGTSLFLEMNYMNDVPFSIWMRGTNFTGETLLRPVSALNKKDHWNKIYIPLSPFVRSNKWLTYQLVFRVELTDDDISAGVKNGTVLIDNVKLLMFK